MPLRDHFRPPVSKRSSWEGFHAMWPAVVVQQLRSKLPPGFIAEPRAHLGSAYEVDIGTFEPSEGWVGSRSGVGGGLATQLWSPSEPSLALETDPLDAAEYEVLIYDLNRERTLVAAIEFVSPANKDRAEHRNAFVGKCAALLHKEIAVVIVDLVTIRHFNLYVELLNFLGYTEAAESVPDEAVYAVALRSVPKRRKARFQAWAEPVAVGSALPTLPLWLNETLAIPVDFETSYETTCHDLQIT